MEHSLIGKIVHYVLPDGPYLGEHRPAIIIKAWSPETVQLGVFMDGTNDGLSDGQLMAWQTSVLHDKNLGVGTWHFPEDTD